MKMEKRTKFQIYFDVLTLLSREMKSGDLHVPTRVAHEANLPYDRFQRCLDHLCELGMLSNDPGKLVVTGKGLEYVREYEKINDFLRHMGLVL